MEWLHKIWQVAKSQDSWTLTLHKWTKWWQGVASTLTKHKTNKQIEGLPTTTATKVNKYTMVSKINSFRTSTVKHQTKFLLHHQFTFQTLRPKKVSLARKLSLATRYIQPMGKEVTPVRTRLALINKCALTIWNHTWLFVVSITSWSVKSAAICHITETTTTKFCSWKLQPRISSKTWTKN